MKEPRRQLAVAIMATSSRHDKTGVATLVLDKYHVWDKPIHIGRKTFWIVIGPETHSDMLFVEKKKIFSTKKSATIISPHDVTDKEERVLIEAIRPYVDWLSSV